MTTAYSDQALRIHADLPVVDGHNDLPWKLWTTVAGDLTRADPSGPLPGFHTDIPRLIAGGVGGQWWSVYVPADTAAPFAATMRQIDLVESLVASDPRLETARTADDVRRIRAAGRVACLLGAEGGHTIEGSLDHLERLAERGVGYMTLTHADTLPWADSATDEARHGGLTDFGRNVVRAMNRLGVLVDISHVSADTMRDALDTSTAPVIASHSNARALAPHPRNLPDDVIETLGRRGGVAMAVFVPGFTIPEAAAASLDLFDHWRRLRRDFGDDEAAIEAEIARYEAELDAPLGHVSDVVDHIEHLADLAGIDAVGLGSDFDGTSTLPAGLDDTSCYPAITDELLARGWSEGDVRKVLGENTLRVMEAAAAIAR